MEEEMKPGSFIRTPRGRVIVAVVVLTAACAGFSAAGSSASTTGTSATPDLSGKHAVVQTFGGDIDKLIQKYYIDPVDSKTHLSATIDNPTDYGKLAVQVKSHNVQWDVVQGDAFFSLKNCGTLLQPMNTLVNRKAIASKYITDKCEVPGETYSFMLMYDKSKFKSGPPKSWADFFNTSKYPGKRGVWGSYVFSGILEGALLADGVPQSRLYPLDLDRAFKKLDTIKSDIKFYDTLAEAQNLMEQGEVSMIVTVGEVGVKADQNGAHFTPVWHQIMTSWDAYFSPKGADPEAAAAILNQIATSKAQSNVIAGDPTSGATTKTFTPPHPTGIKLAFSPDVQGRARTAVILNQRWWADNLDPVSTRWTAFASS
jgi:putative spermidine/putrescine transport system substrate-binding protein